MITIMVTYEQYIHQQQKKAKQALSSSAMKSKQKKMEKSHEYNDAAINYGQ